MKNTPPHPSTLDPSFLCSSRKGLEGRAAIDSQFDPRNNGGLPIGQYKVIDHFPTFTIEAEDWQRGLVMKILRRTLNGLPEVEDGQIIWSDARRPYGLE